MIPKHVVNHDICRGCKGKCCQHSGCQLFPVNISNSISDFIKELETKIKTEKYSFILAFKEDEWSNRIDFQLRLRVRNRGKGLFDLCTQLAPCKLWMKESGCPFSDEERPYGGLHLIPDEYDFCQCDYSDEFAFSQWSIFQYEMETVFEKYSSGLKVLEVLKKQYIININSLREAAKHDSYLDNLICKTERILYQEGLM